VRFSAVLASVLFGIVHTGWCIASEPEDMPPIELPASFKPYAYVSKVIDAAASAIKLLGTAKFDDLPTDNALVTPPCNASTIASFYRGMMLVKAGYYVFINKMERGFESLDTPHPTELPQAAAVPPATFGALVRPGRELLIGVWNQDKLRRLLTLTSVARQLPPEIKVDLAAFFDTLREFASRYDALKRRAPSDLASLNRRATLLYSYERSSTLVFAKRDGEAGFRRAQVRYPETVRGEDYAKEMRLLLNANRDVGQRTVSECLDGGDFAQVRLGDNAELSLGYSPPSLFPTSYMIGFWQRRDSEGTSMLARFALERLLSELKQ
jgi:hypothetical protein